MSDSIASKILIELALTNEYTNLSDEYKKRCQKEILVMQESPGLSKDNILEEFYSIYKSLNGKKGDKNVINSVVAYCLQMSSKLPDLSDEFLAPIINENAGPNSSIKEGDVVLFFNFRTDRGRELTEALSQQDFHEQNMHKLNLHQEFPMQFVDFYYYYHAYSHEVLHHYVLLQVHVESEYQSSLVLGSFYDNLKIPPYYSTSLGGTLLLLCVSYELSIFGE